MALHTPPLVLLHSLSWTWHCLGLQSLHCVVLSSQACHRHPCCEGLDIGAYLLTPIQRMPRYVLLLKVCCAGVMLELLGQYCRMLIGSVSRAICTLVACLDLGHVFAMFFIVEFVEVHRPGAP